MKAVKQVVAIAVSGVAFSFCSSFCVAQHVTGELGSPSATTTIGGKQLPPPDPKFGGVIKEKASESKAWWPPRVVPPKGAPNVLLIMMDDVGFGAHEHLRRRGPDPRAGSHRQERAALHAVSFDLAVLAHARRLDHRAQSPRGRLWGRGRSRHRVPRLRFDHPQGCWHHRHHLEGARVRDLVVRQGPQHPLLPVQPGRAVRSVAGRDGLRLFLRLHRRRHQPVATEPVPQYHAPSTPSKAIPAGI